jgi:hypothetical protein
MIGTSTATWEIDVGIVGGIFWVEFVVTGWTTTVGLTIAGMTGGYCLSFFPATGTFTIFFVT